MQNQDEIHLIGRLLRERLTSLKSEAEQLSPDPYEPKPAVIFGKAMDMLRYAVDCLSKSIVDVGIEIENLNKLLSGSTMGNTDMSAIEGAVTKVVDRVRDIYRIEFQLLQVTPPRLLEGCFHQFQGIGHQCTERLIISAREIEKQAENTSITDKIIVDFNLGLDSNIEQLNAEMARVRDIMLEVEQF